VHWRQFCLIVHDVFVVDACNINMHALNIAEQHSVLDRMAGNNIRQYEVQTGHVLAY